MATMARGGADICHFEDNSRNRANIFAERLGAVERERVHFILLTMFSGEEVILDHLSSSSSSSLPVTEKQAVRKITQTHR